MFWTSTAYAMSPVGEGGEASLITTMGPLILMFAVFYLLLIRPQQKRAREHKEMVAALRKGDEVITNGGILGRIVETQEETVTLDLGQTRVTIMRSSIAALKNYDTANKKDKKGAKQAEKKSEDPEE